MNKDRQFILFVSIIIALGVICISAGLVFAGTGLILMATVIAISHIIQKKKQSSETHVVFSS
jgi:hypothetical protein